MSDKIYIVSFPKSGRMWFCYTLARYFARLNGLDGVGFNNLSYSKCFFTFDRQVRSSRYSGFPKIVVEHCGVSVVPQTAKTIVICRNVLDTLVSYFFHCRFDAKKSGQPDWKKDQIFDFVRDKLNDWFHYHVDGLRTAQQRGAMVVVYRNIGNRETFLRFFEYCGIKCDESILDAAMQDASFDSMAGDEEANPIFSIGYEDRDDRRTRRGVVFGYKEYLSENQICELGVEIKSKFSDSDFDLLCGFDLLRF